MGRHTGKTHIVAGALGLIGRAVARRLREDGAKVIEMDLRQEWGIDIGDPVVLYPALRGIAFDGFVNAAYPREPAAHARCYRVATQIVAETLVEGGRGGAIVNFASIYGLLGPDYRIYEDTAMTMPLEYAEVKGGIISLSRAAATRWGKYGVRVNCISPGGVEDGQPEAFLRRYVARVPLGRMARPDDLAGVVSFLLSDDANYITGQNIVVDGGLTAW